VMGCVVNGPGEAREADLGIAAGKGQGFLVVRGEVVDKIPEDRFVDRLLEEARKIAADRASDDGVGNDGTEAGPVVPEPAVSPSKA
jgi:(E)-4-hydroxy-3-methylbut-2-enyl-diphosphate synthase